VLLGGGDVEPRRQSVWRRRATLAIAMDLRLFCSPSPHKIELTLDNPPVPPEIDAAVAAWMRRHGWQVPSARWQREPEMGFYIWQEDASKDGKAHGLWVEDVMVRRLTPEQLVEVLNQEGLAEDIRINFKVRIEERGAEYRVSVVPRRSGEFPRQE
jgi:hypothetical protein